MRNSSAATGAARARMSKKYIINRMGVDPFSVFRKRPNAWFMANGDLTKKIGVG